LHYINGDKNMNNHIAIYQSGEIEVEVSIENETVWLSRQQLSSLFDRENEN